MIDSAEFRQDIVSGEWVLIAPKRKARMYADFKPATHATSPACPFDDLTGQELVWSLPGENLEVTVIKNKFPAVQPGLCAPLAKVGPFQTHLGTGTHDVFVHGNHETAFSDFSKEQLTTVIQAFKKRYKEIAQTDDCAHYIHLFHNYGAEAGASIAHPHSQIISTPMVPPDATRSLWGAHRFYREEGKRVYDVMLEWEREQDKRIICENGQFVAFCPFVSKYPYEVRIFSRESHAHFDQMPDELDQHLADILGTVLRKIKKALNDPAYNFFIHTAPIETSLHDLHEFYSWHIEILPKVKIDAGLEIGTGFGVNVIDPDEAAELLRNA